MEPKRRADVHHELRRLDDQDLGCREQEETEERDCGKVEGEGCEDEGDGMWVFAGWEAYWRRCVFVFLIILSSVARMFVERGARALTVVVVACVDGALHLWKTNSNLVRPDQTIEGAHGKGTETGSLTFSVDGTTLLTRGGDDTVKRAPSASSFASMPSLYLILAPLSVYLSPLTALPELIVDRRYSMGSPCVQETTRDEGECPHALPDDKRDLQPGQ